MIWEKYERTVTSNIVSLANTLSRFAMDICLYASQNLDFISFPDELTTGSSIMPHKKNPDIFELVHGKCNKLQAIANEMILITNNLPSGYHRDYQLIKENSMYAVENIKEILDVFTYAISQIKLPETITISGSTGQLNKNQIIVICLKVMFLLLIVIFSTSLKKKTYSNRTQTGEGASTLSMNFNCPVSSSLLKETKLLVCRLATTRNFSSDDNAKLRGPSPLVLILVISLSSPPPSSISKIAMLLWPRIEA